MTVGLFMERRQVFLSLETSETTPLTLPELLNIIVDRLLILLVGVFP